MTTKARIRAYARQDHLHPNKHGNYTLADHLNRLTPAQRRRVNRKRSR